MILVRVQVQFQAEAQIIEMELVALLSKFRNGLEYQYKTHNYAFSENVRIREGQLKEHVPLGKNGLNF